MLSNEKYKEIVETMPILCVDCVVTKGNKVLLVKRLNEPLKDEWWVPGGRVIKNETLIEAVKRKMLEEIGVEVDVHEFIGLYEGLFDESAHGCSTHTVSAVFTVTPLSDDIKVDEQSGEWKWADELPELFSDGLRAW